MTLPIVVVGASAGGVEALGALLEGLPPDLPAAVLVALHLPPGGRSLLPQVLARRSALPVTQAEHGAPLRPGSVVTAVPDRHLLVRGGHVVLGAAGRENGHRPSHDAMMRSAALEAGPATVGVVLSGLLDDGSAGLRCVDRYGGTCLVQDPAEALFPAMPANALRAVPTARAAGLAALGGLVAEAVRAAPGGRPQVGPHDRSRDEGKLVSALAALPTTPPPAAPGSPSDLACPDCHGVLSSVPDGDLPRLRCRTGHAWTADALLARRGTAVEDALWTVVRTLEEGASATGRSAALLSRSPSDRTTVPEPDVVDDAFESLLGYLRDQRGADFTGYKRPSLQRLVGRRLQACGVEDYAGYVDRLQVEPGELQALLDTLLVNVTSFFRDPDTWAELQDRLLPEVLARLDSDEPVRVWSAACATGEEAYTLAMVLHGLLGDEAYKARVKVYATDVDEHALQVARQGRYPLQALTALTDAQRATYFSPDGDGYARFRADLRPTLIFGRHDLLTDAPISRVLLLSCRNALMYLTADTQARVLERFPFALHDRGLLLVGRAEMLLSHGALFTPVDLAHRVFTARRIARASRLAMLAVGGQGRSPELRQVVEAAFVAAPDAQLVLDSSGVLALWNDRAETDLGLQRSDLGRPFVELEVARQPADLRGSAASVQASGDPVDITDVAWTRGSTTHWDIRLAPLHLGPDVLGVHVVFRDVTDLHRLRRQLQELQQDLSTAYEEVQSGAEELETANEELQSAVEELETTNEELQSTNEELETMNEELQSTNEELQALNDELRERTLQVDESNSFLQGVLEGLEDALVVVDPSYRVQLWNGGAEALVGLRQFEAEGVLLLDLALQLPVEEVHAAVRAVLSGEQQRTAVTALVTDRLGHRRQRVLSASPLRPPARGALVSLRDQPVPVG